MKHLILLLISVNICSAQFNEISKIANIQHTHIAPDLMGGGVAVLDFNNDGLEDLYFTGGTKWDKLFLNIGNNEFKDLTISSGIYNFTRTVKTTGVSAGDINNDGFTDLLITTGNGKPLLLLLNNGDSTFSDEDTKLFFNQYTQWSMGAAMGDVNNDGLIDLYVINYIEEFNSIFDEQGKVIGFDHQCANNLLFINQGEDTFTEESVNWNVDDDGCGLAVAFTDINNDNIQDIFIANDFGEWIEPNKAYMHDLNLPQFSEKGVQVGLNDSIYGMGIAIGSISRENRNDYYVTNLGVNVLRKSENISFDNITESSGTQAGFVDDLRSTGWGAMFIDVNNDGYNDLFVSNGYIGAADFIEASEIDPNNLFLNNGDNTFEDISTEVKLDFSGISRGCAWSDFNNDGYADILVSNLERTTYRPESNVLVYENKYNSNSWIGFILEGTTINRDALGAKVYLFSGNNIFFKELTTSGSHASSHSKRILFGLGEINLIDSIKIQWNDKIETIIKGDIQANRYYKIIEGSGKAYSLGCNIKDAQNFTGEEFDISWGCINAKESVVSSLESKLNKNEFQIYPNPVINTLHISFPKEYSDLGLRIDIIDLAGKTMLNDKKYKTENNLITIDLAKIPSGVYTLHIVSATKAISNKIVIVEK